MEMRLLRINNNVFRNITRRMTFRPQKNKQTKKLKLKESRKINIWVVFGVEHHMLRFMRRQYPQEETRGQPPPCN